MKNENNNPPTVCGVGMPFKLPDHYTPDQFLWGNNGPWPSQPDPLKGNACKIAPEVLSNEPGQNEPHCIPKDENDEWQDKLGTYLTGWLNVFNFTKDAIDSASKQLGLDLWFYRKANAGWMIKDWYDSKERPSEAKDYPGQYGPLSDSDFTELIAHGLLSKLVTKLDPPDEIIFKNFLGKPDRSYWKCDSTHMRVVRETWPNEYVAPTIVLLSRPTNLTPDNQYDFRVEAIALFVQSQPRGPYDKQNIFTGSDGDRWTLAKYFALQGALIRINLIDHTMVHFPCDAINAITKSVLPTSNRIYQLLIDHFYLSLPVDNAVLEGPKSLLIRTSSYPYGPYPAKGDEIRKVFQFYWFGSETVDGPVESWAPGRANAFPKYSFSTEPREVPSRYGTFLNAYYLPILRFTSAVVETIPDDDHAWAAICHWADSIASWIPGFPNGEQINRNSDLLAKTCASIIWNCAIVHTADHWMMHQMFKDGYPTPYILRDKPPEQSTGTATPESADFRPKAFLVLDAVPANLCDLMFFRPHNTTTLIDTSYQFAPPLSDLVSRFHDDLIKTDQAMQGRFPEFKIRMKYQTETQKKQDCFAAGVQF